jgi:DNA-binding IclR family transcriptional regulator
MTARGGPAQPVQSVDRAMALLQALADASNNPDGDGASTVAELAQVCDLNRSTAWRLLATLEQRGMVERDPRTSRYSVGYGAVRVGAAASAHSLVRRAAPELDALALQVGETVSLAVARGVTLAYVHHSAVNGFAYQLWANQPLALHSSSAGKIFLAWLPEQERRAALPRVLERFTDQTVTDIETLETELTHAREVGYAVCASEDALFTNGVSAAVLDGRDRPVAIVNIWGPEQRIPTTRFPDLGVAARAAADRVAARLAA